MQGRSPSRRRLERDVTSLSPDGSVVLLRPRTRMRTCPVCGTRNAREIVYGLPDFDLSLDPRVVLGGCVVSTVEDDFLRWACRNPDCGAWFGRDVRQLRSVGEDGVAWYERPSIIDADRPE